MRSRKRYPSNRKDRRSVRKREKKGARRMAGQKIIRDRIFFGSALFLDEHTHLCGFFCLVSYPSPAALDVGCVNFVMCPSGPVYLVGEAQEIGPTNQPAFDASISWILGYIPCWHNFLNLYLLLFWLVGNFRNQNCGIGKQEEIIPQGSVEFSGLGSYILKTFDMKPMATLNARNLL